MAKANAGARRLPGLEALRLIAASCVLFLHALANYGVGHWAGRGYLGVDFFLMLSGFLMTRIQEDRLAAGMRPTTFMVKRYARLWPMMALGGLLGLYRLYKVRAHGLWDFAWTGAANLLLIPVPWHQFVFPLNVPAWTITCELICNAAHVFVLWRVRGKWLWGLLALMMPLEIWFGAQWHFYNVGALPSNFWEGVGRCLFAYTLGIGISRWWRAGAPLPMPWWIALPLMPALLLVSTWLNLRGWGWELGFILLGCPLMIAGGIRLDRFHSLAEWMGRLSFPLFALQMPIIEGAKMLHFGYWWAVGGAYALAIGATLASYGLEQRKKRLAKM